MDADEVRRRNYQKGQRIIIENYAVQALEMLGNAVFLYLERERW